MYLFPEPTILITGSFYSQGKETTFEIGSENYGPNDFISWFYDLELTACDEPEAVEGAESYTFKVAGKDAFTYEDRGSEAYIIIDSNYYIRERFATHSVVIPVNMQNLLFRFLFSPHMA